MQTSSKIFTARIRSMTGRYCFHRCLSVNISGGVPGLRFSGGGTLVSDFRGGVPGLRFSGGVPVLRFSGGAVPGLRKLLWLHSGQYASCVHAGGLSCLCNVFKDYLGIGNHPTLRFLVHCRQI